MLDVHESSRVTEIMSRKRTRSRLELSSSEETNNFPHLSPVAGINCGAPFSDDPGPTKIRNEFHYYNKITLQMVRSGLINPNRPIRVYCDGVFDLFHQGHARVLMQAKQSLPNVYLIVGVCNDKVVNRKKGRTVLTEDERYNAVRHCRYVDEVLKNAPWEYSNDFLEKYKIDFVAHDDLPYESANTDDIYKAFKEQDIFLATQRTEDVSTSDIVARIVKDYDMYVRRNLKRGYSAKDLNISYLNEQKFRIQIKMNELKSLVSEKTDDILKQWEDKSREFIDNFLLNFFKKPLKFCRNSLLKAITSSDSENSDNEASPCKVRRLY